MNEPNFSMWEAEIGKPVWYNKIVPDFQKVVTLKKSDPDEYERVKELVYDFIEKHLVNGNIHLGSSGKNWDIERKPLDTVVIHHTSNLPGIRPSRLSAIELIRLYAPQYAAPKYEADIAIKGQPVYSGHFRGEKQIFYPYQWLVRTDGTAERLLLDEEIGWQAGNWEMNCRSVAICLDGDFEDTDPSKAELAAVADIIHEHYPHVYKERVLGHCEVNIHTTCPSKFFLDTESRKGWKNDLLALV
jgi:hypothetical protein